MKLKPKEPNQVDLEDPIIEVVAIATYSSPKPTYSSTKPGNFRVDEYIDLDGNKRRLMIPGSIVNDKFKLKKLLIDHCFKTSPEKKLWTDIQEILNAGTDKRMQLVETPGFHNGVFLQSNNEIIGNIPDGKYRPILDPNSKIPKHSVERKGDLLDWQSQVAISGLYSSRLLLAMAAAFSSSLLRITGIESGGLYFYGMTSIGKSTVEYVAISVQGAQDSIESWSITKTGVEEVAAGFNDQMLVFDELGNSDGSPERASQKVTEIIYALTFGKDKRRSTTYTDERLNWRIIIISSGENSLTEHAAEGNTKRMQGEEVRLIDVPADAGEGMGIFEKLPAGISPAQYAENLKLSCKEFYGVPQQLFLKNLVIQMADDYEAVKERINSCMDKFMVKHKIDGSKGFEQRIAKRFALAYAAGKLAVDYGILPFGEKDVMKGVSKCYVDTINSRPKSENDLVQIAYETISNDLNQAENYLDIRKPGHRYSIEQLEQARGYMSIVNKKEVRVIKSDTLESLISDEKTRKKALDLYVAEGRLLCDANNKLTRPVRSHLKDTNKRPLILPRAYCFLPKQKNTKS